jgi:hypothetical protein
MKMQIPVNNSDFEKPEAGIHRARCYGIVDTGTHKRDTKFGEKFQRLIYLYFELPFCRTEKGDPMMVRQRYALSGHPNAPLVKHLAGWRGKSQLSKAEIQDIALEKIVGAPAVLQISHSEDGQYTNVESISQFKRDQFGSTPMPEMHNKRLFVSLEKGEFDKAAFDGLHEKLKDWIAESPEYAELFKKPAGAQGRGQSFEGTGSGDHTEGRFDAPPPDSWDQTGGDEIPF